MIGETLQQMLADAGEDEQVEAVVLLRDERHGQERKPQRTQFSNKKEYRKALLDFQISLGESLAKPVRSLLKDAGIEIVSEVTLFRAMLVRGTPSAIQKASEFDGVSSIVANVPFYLPEDPQ